MSTAPEPLGSHGVVPMPSTSQRVMGLVLTALVVGCSSPVVGADGAMPHDTWSTPDAGSPPTDGGLDAGAPPTDTGLDVGASDAGPDASAGRCNAHAPFGVPTLVMGLDSTSTDDDAALTSDELVVVFASTRPPGPATQLWTASRGLRSGAFSSVRRIDTLVTGPVHTQPWLSPDGLTLYYRTDTATDTEIVVTTRATRAVDFMPGAAVAAISSSALEQTPFLTATALYFGRQPADTSAARDLWSATRLAGGFGSPALLSELDTTAEESNPTLSADELTIYFSSNRSGGGARGGNDIWRATRPSVSVAFTSIENVAELNTSADEWPDYLSDDGCRLYVTTTMAGDFGLYVAERSP